MSRSAQPDNWQELIAGYTLGDLSPDEVEAFQQLLADHPELMQEVDSVQEVLALMPYALPEHDPPAHLREAILTAAQADQLAPPATQPSLRRRLTRWLGIAGSVAAAALIGLGLDNYRLRQEVAATRPIVTALQQPDRQVYALTGTPQAARASGSIVLTPQQQVLLVAQNLPELPAGQAYRLWAMPQNSQQPAFCGQFNTTSAGTVTAQWAAADQLCSRQPTQLLITAESATAPPVPQGELVMQSRQS